MLVGVLFGCLILKPMRGKKEIREEEREGDEEKYGKREPRRKEEEEEGEGFGTHPNFFLIIFL